MDLAYDHIEEKAYAKKEEEDDGKDGTKPQEPQSTLNEDLQQAYKAFSNSPWGARLGGFLGNVVKQSESVYTQAQKELAEVGEDASKGLTDLRATIIGHTRNLSLNPAAGESSKTMEDGESTPTNTKDGEAAGESSQQSENVLERLRSEAAKRLKDLQRAEDAADEALLRFGGNVRDFLRDAVSVAPPDGSDQSGTVLFESKDPQGKRVVHASRFDAQLHVIHTSTDSFSKDPTGPEFEAWAKDFDVDKKTPDINDDLQKHPELRSTMEKLVPDQIPYADFWKRYYFLRRSIEAAEARRRDLLKAAEAEDEVSWDDDSDDETTAATERGKVKSGSATSSTTIHPPAQKLLKPNESRKSNDEKSQADSEASYDVVGATSGKTTQAPNSPKEAKKGEDSDDDWE